MLGAEIASYFPSPNEMFSSIRAFGTDLARRESRGGTKAAYFFPLRKKSASSRTLGHVSNAYIPAVG